MMREHLPHERVGLTHHFMIMSKAGDVDGYLMTGCYDDGRLGEVFVRAGKDSDVGALLDQWAIAVSVALQYGADLDDLARKFVGCRFEPSGPTCCSDVPRCTSPLDYAARWILLKYGKKEEAHG